MVEQAAAQPLLAERRGELERRGSRKPLVPAAVVARTEDVVQRQTGVVERLGEVRQPVDREQEGLDPDEMGRERQQVRALVERLADKAESKLLQVPEPAVDQPR